MKFRYTPFEKALKDVKPAELETLRSVAEGWYVEYKSRPLSTKALAKSLSSFANQYGGWIVFGVEEDTDTLKAKAFPGINSSLVSQLLQLLKEASRGSLNPDVFYETRVFEGPIDEVGLTQDHSIVVVRIPPGADTPYIHSDGRIYRRIADSTVRAPHEARLCNK